MAHVYAYPRGLVDAMVRIGTHPCRVVPTPLAGVHMHGGFGVHMHGGFGVHMHGGFRVHVYAQQGCTCTAGVYMHMDTD